MMMATTTTAPVIDRVLALVARQLRHPDQHSRLAADAALEGDLRIDAIDRLCISCAVEEEWRIDLTDHEIEAWHCVADIARSIERRGAS